MLTKFFFMLKEGGMKPSITELLMLLEALQRGVAGHSVDDFYYLSRAALVKDETQFDRFDRIFAAHFEGIEDAFKSLSGEVPEDWLQRQAELMLSEEERAQIEAMGGFDKLMEALRERLEEQGERHEGGSKWIGTAGTSPFGAYGYNPEGVRIGQQGSRHRRAVKVWDRREYRNLDDKIELGTRNIKIALRKLRKFAREGAADELDLDDTIDKTARNGGLLDIRMVPERHNAVKVLLCLDIGGSMDDHVRVCEEMFSAARSEFKHLEYFYFHNFVYESMWKDNRRRHAPVYFAAGTRHYQQRQHAKQTGQCAHENRTQAVTQRLVNRVAAAESLGCGSAGLGNQQNGVIDYQPQQNDEADHAQQIQRLELDRVNQGNRQDPAHRRQRNGNRYKYCVL